MQEGIWSERRLTLLFEVTLERNDLLGSKPSEPPWHLEIDLTEEIEIGEIQGHDAYNLDVVDEDAREGGEAGIFGIVLDLEED